MLPIRIIKGVIMKSLSKVFIMVLILLYGCAGAEIYRQNCVDIASSAAHTYQRMFQEDAYVAVGRTKSGELHSQAYCLQDGDVKWITATHGQYYTNKTISIIAVGVDRELDTIISHFSLEEFDNKYGAYKWRKK